MVAQFFAMFSNVPGTRTTGLGWAAEGLQDQSFAPGGETSTVAASVAGAAAMDAQSSAMVARIAGLVRRGTEIPLRLDASAVTVCMERSEVGDRPPGL